MDNLLKTILWQQLGAAIDMLDNALQACPDHLWRAPLWSDPTDAPEYSEFWYIGYHTLFYLDLYLHGSRTGFAPPAPFVARGLPKQPYHKAALLTYLAACREKCRTSLESMTDERANQRCQFPWIECTFAELQLYSMRHIQEHAAQLNMLLGQKVGSAPDWVPQASRKNS